MPSDDLIERLAATIERLTRERDEARHDVSDLLPKLDADAMTISNLSTALAASQAREAEMGRRNAVLEAEVHDEALSASGYLAALRHGGWRVAVHNDYRMHGQDWTFWLLTHPSGVWAKGEGVSDGLALANAHDAARAAISAQADGIAGTDEGEGL